MAMARKPVGTKSAAAADAAATVSGARARVAPAKGVKPKTKAASREAAARKSKPASAPPATTTPDVGRAPASGGAGAAAGASEVHPAVPGPAADVAQGARFRRQDLISAIATRSDMKRSELKEVVDLVLEELGRAADAGDTLVLPPLGKLLVKKRMEGGTGASVLTLKLRRTPPTGAGASAPKAR